MYHLLARYKLLTLHLIIVILGFTGIFGKLITLGTIELVWYRMLIAFISLFIFLAYKKQLFDISRKDSLALLGIGAIVALHWFFFFESIKVSNVSVAVVCLATSSFFSSLIEPIFFKRKLLLYEVILGILVFITLAYVLGADTKYTLGYIYGISAALLGTLFTIYNAKYIQRIDAAKISMIEMLAGVIIFSIILILSENYTVFTELISFSDFTYLIILGTICTAGAFVWMTEIMRHITPYSLIMAINLEPIYSIILALIIFGDSEMMSTQFYIGGSIIIGIVFLEGYLKNR